MNQYKESPCRRCKAGVTKGLCDGCIKLSWAEMLRGHVKTPCMACHKLHKGECHV